MKQYWNKYKHFIAAIIFSILVFGCTEIKKLTYQHQEKKLQKINLKNPELTDSLLHIWFPPSQTIGTVDTNKKDLDSIAYYKKQADSLSHLKPTITHIHDTTNKCEDSTELFIDDSDNYYNGYNNGVEEGKALGRASCPVSTITHDSTMTSQQAVAFKALQEQNATLTSQHISDNTKIEDRNVALAISIGSDILLLVGLVLALKSLLKKKATNTITSEIQKL